MQCSLLSTYLQPESSELSESLNCGLRDSFLGVVNQRIILLSHDSLSDGNQHLQVLLLLLVQRLGVGEGLVPDHQPSEDVLDK